MVGGDENLLVLNEWAAPSPSPRSFFSSLLKDGISAISCSNIAQDNRKQWPPSVAYEQNAATSMDEEGNENGSEGFGAGDSLSETKVLSVQKPSSSSFSERMSARGGFNTPSLNITKVSGLSSSHPDVRSSYLTIPSGLSPTTLLDSPVFLSNSLTQQSPTTGKISSELFGEKRLRSASLSKDQSFQDINAASFAFKPHPGSSTSCFPSRPQSHRLAAAVNGHQPRPSIEVSVMSLRPAAAQNLEVTNNQQQELQPCLLFSDDIKKNNGNVSKSTEVDTDDTEIKRPPVEREDMGDDYRGEYYSTLVEAPSEDGYNWRKYGQKQVKGSEFPRSYYKCTHPDCPVKKKVERSQEGHITEIIYKGAHNHSKPQASRRSATGSSSHLLSDQQQSMWAPGEGPSAALASEFCGQLATIADELASREKVHAAIDVSSAESIDEEGDECVSQRGQDDEEDDSESKRRKLDSCVTEMSGNSRSIREPRVVVQTTSEVDILDDGYRWRKYGQKVVKGNPNPRSYYKCTNAGCNVRKHVERASHDLKSVITTYEGKHNHDVPAAKNNSHVNSASSSMSSVSSAPFVSRPEPSLLHQEIPRFANPLLRRQIMGSPGFSFPVGQQSISNLDMGCLGGATQSKVPSMHMHQSFYDNQGRGNGLGLMMPKEETKEPAPFTSSIPIGSSIYHQLMSRLPL